MVGVITERFLPDPNTCNLVKKEGWLEMTLETGITDSHYITATKRSPEAAAITRVDCNPHFWGDIL